MIEFIQSRPWLYRGLRTFFQAFLSTLAGQVILVEQGEMNEKLIFSVLVSSMAAGLAALMNAGESSSSDGNNIV